MTYMLLILEPLGQRQSRTKAEGMAAYDAMVAFGQELQDQGLLVASQSLSGHAEATRVQVRQGQAQVLDGPFAEAKEMVGGFFLLNCASKAEAVAIAQRCPAAQWCTVEVRSLAPCHDDAS
jgi:hypothetical protein